MQIDMTKLHAIADHFGIDAQTDKAMEELDELKLAIVNYYSIPREPESISGMVDELADVAIMVEQLVYLLGVGDDVQARIDYKLQRTIGRYGIEANGE